MLLTEYWKFCPRIIFQQVLEVKINKTWIFIAEIAAASFSRHHN
jgi:hypothetical protein